MTVAKGGASQRRIGAWLTRHFPNVQFIVATHSRYICQAADPGGLIHFDQLMGRDVALAGLLVDLG